VQGTQDGAVPARAWVGDGAARGGREHAGRDGYRPDRDDHGQHMDREQELRHEPATPNQPSSLSINPTLAGLGPDWNGP
jgi:hypothetical protein